MLNCVQGGGEDHVDAWFCLGGGGGGEPPAGFSCARLRLDVWAYIFTPEKTTRNQNKRPPLNNNNNNNNNVNTCNILQEKQTRAWFTMVCLLQKSLG